MKSLKQAIQESLQINESKQFDSKKLLSTLIDEYPYLNDMKLIIILLFVMILKI